MSYYTKTGEGGIYESPYCQVGKEDAREQAVTQATSEGLDAVSLASIQCQKIA
jgi:hypothetical protein